MLLSFKYQMPPTGLCVSNLGPQLVVLFRETIEPLGQGPSLARTGHDGKTLKDMPTTKFSLKLSAFWSPKRQTSHSARSHHQQQNLLLCLPSHGELASTETLNQIKPFLPYIVRKHIRLVLTLSVCTEKTLQHSVQFSLTLQGLS